MFKKKEAIDLEIERVLCKLSSMEPDSDQYVKAVANLEVLYTSRSYKAKNDISMETVVAAATNIVGILLVLNYEHIHVVTSKAISFVFKGRL